VTGAPDDGLAAAKRAQERVWSLQSAGVGPNAPEARRAVNQMISRLRSLSATDLAAFEAWKAGSRPDPGHGPER
jgi:hypothetical protein